MTANDPLRAALERMVAESEFGWGRVPSVQALQQARAALASDAPEARYTDGCLTDEQHRAHKAASEAGRSVGALDVERLARALANVWKGLRWEHFTESQHLTDGELAAAIAAAYDAERQGES